MSETNQNSSTLSSCRRSDIWKNFSTQDFDLCIIGGGINGAGIARDAAMRGMRVALVEERDFASGTSSRSSKLVHGGIRYLENLEFHLVFEALSERQKLFNMAPHLVHPLRFMIPLYKTGRVGMFKMGLGMWLYDALSLFQAPEMHEKLGVRETLQRMPFLKEKDLLGSFIYSDAYMDDDRLVHETLRSASAHGAQILNYTSADRVHKNSEGKVIAIDVIDRETNQKCKILAKHFVSTVGPWTDELGQKLFNPWKDVLRPTKGVHLTFQKSKVPLHSAVVMATEERIVFGIPRHEMVIVGTTDTDFKGDPAKVSVTPEDVRYLLGVVENYFPGVQVKESDIVATYAGVRPLVKDDAATEGKTSREHSIWTHESGLTFVAGGKYTTYRLIAKQALEHCLHAFSIEERVRFNRCSTQLPLNKKIDEDSYHQRETWMSDVQHLHPTLPLSHAQKLLERHGAEAIDIIKKFGALDLWELEASHAIHETMCMNLVDFYARRAPLFLAEPDHGISLLPVLAKVFSRELSWSTEKTNQMIQDLHQYMAAELSWKK